MPWRSKMHGLGKGQAAGYFVEDGKETKYGEREWRREEGRRGMGGKRKFPLRRCEKKGGMGPSAKKGKVVVEQNSREMGGIELGKGGGLQHKEVQLAVSGKKKKKQKNDKRGNKKENSKAHTEGKDNFLGGDWGEGGVFGGGEKKKKKRYGIA